MDPTCQLLAPSSQLPALMPPIPVLTPEQSKSWDQRAVAAGVELATLMESAGRAVAVVLSDRYAHLHPSCARGWRGSRGPNVCGR